VYKKQAGPFLSWLLSGNCRICDFTCSGGPLSRGKEEIFKLGREKGGKKIWQKCDKRWWG